MKSELKTVFFCGEGKTDKVFIDHLINCFKHGERVRANKAVPANGGTPEGIINEAIRRTNNINFDHKIIVMDNDKPIFETLYNEAKSLGFIFLLPPFKNAEIEAWLHFIKDSSYSLTGDYKKEFYRQYKTEKTDVLTKKDCIEIFPKSELDKASKHCDRLKALIELLIEGNWVGYADERVTPHPNLEK